MATNPDDFGDLVRRRLAGLGAGPPRVHLPLVPAPAGPTALAEIRRFRPVPFEGPEQTHRVEIVGILRVGGDAIASCRDRDEPNWHYEVFTPLRVEVGMVGTIRSVRGLLRSPPRWIFAFEFARVSGEGDANGPLA